MLFGDSLFWRETHKQPRFLIFDGRLVVLLLLMIMHLRLWTILLVVFTSLALWLFDRKGVSADSILRFVRSAIVGRKRSARGPDYERLPVDFGFETEKDVEVMRQIIIGRQKVHEKNLKKRKPVKK